MIYIGTTEDDSSAIYFDIHAAEQQGRGVRISGTVGDGSYEGEVLVEVGRNDSVTFADAWLGGAGFQEFLARCGARQLEQSLLEAVRELPLFQCRPCLPHGNGLAYAAGIVAEPAPRWQRGA